jgi:hypothetical protein
MSADNVLRVQAQWRAFAHEGLEAVLRMVQGRAVGKILPGC